MPDSSPLESSPTDRVAARPSLAVAAALLGVALALFVVGMFRPRAVFTHPLLEPVALSPEGAGFLVIGVVGLLMAVRVGYHRRTNTERPPPVRFEGRLRMLESALGVVLLLAATWVYGVDHVQGDILYFPVFGILIGVLAAFGLLVVVPTHLALVLVAPSGE